MILTVLAPFLTRCGSQQTAFTPADSLATADTLRRIVIEAAARLSTLDPDSVLAAFSREPEFAWIADAHLFENWDSVRADARRRYAGLKTLTLRWDTLRVVALTSKSGVVSGVATARLTDTLGGSAGIRAGATYVMVRRPSGWRILAGHASHAPIAP
jgi:hypothetical protein